jgi:hypothetical protein
MFRSNKLQPLWTGAGAVDCFFFGFLRIKYEKKSNGVQVRWWTGAGVVGLDHHSLAQLSHSRWVDGR